MASPATIARLAAVIAELTAQLATLKALSKKEHADG